MHNVLLGIVFLILLLLFGESLPLLFILGILLLIFAVIALVIGLLLAMIIAATKFFLDLL